MVKTEEALAIIGGHVDEELLLRNEYLAIENEILRKKIEGRIKLSQCERTRLATIGKKIGIKALRDVAMIVKPETILTWYRKLIAAKFDSSKKREKKVRNGIRGLLLLPQSGESLFYLQQSLPHRFAYLP